LGLVGWQKLVLDPAAGTASKTVPELYVDLSAVAKGYAVDRTAAVLDQMGLEDYMVEVGGEVRTRGLNLKRQPWRIGIERPVAESRELQRVVPLSGLAMATSGDYRNFYVLDGERYSHTIDARTGRPVTHGAASVSVVTEECLWADGWATALLVMGPEEGFALAQEQGLAALFLVYDGENDFQEKATDAFRELIGSAEGAV
jgi:thiamine biosynthesis lipoprotein